ncbi:hypothetical protein FNV43_RR19665 [Rhamnella rubrinervis]|uniref:FIST C-domain domain-containing protein n=1 Tax=Rhamnella rubrinervis TaxID=2594499 RepID=A0A8K0E4Z2_9ROSA|nr:hypothetical protein FNV43_RR19665 [Rhamnella rubrinervis]
MSVKAWGTGVVPAKDTPTLKSITKTIGFKTPVITNAASGIIGIDAITDEIKEVKWDLIDEDESDFHGYNLLDNLNRGIILVVGFVPGLKVETIPLLRPKNEPQEAMVDKFVMDIRNYTASVSGCMSPASIMMFGDQYVNMKPNMAKIDYAMAEDTVIVGDASGCFLFKCGDNSTSYGRDLYSFDAVALVFARDKDKSHGVGETQFHVALSSGITPFGPRLKALSVGVKGSECTWLSVLVEQHDLIIDGQRLIDAINRELNYPDLYIGVTQHRECAIGSEKSSLATTLTFYEVLGHPNVDSAPFFLNFPGVPLAGVFCAGEIGRGSLRLNGLEEDDDEEEEEDDSPRCCLHFYGTVYLVMSYVPAPPQHYS